jgi:trehalose 6-phosphate phosphatase
VRHLLTRVGDLAIAAVMARDPVLAFDFDGTLAPLVERPPLARISDPTADRLRELAERHPVVIISGRAVGDVAPRLSGIAIAGISGNHGLEPWGATPEIEARVDGWARALAERFGLVPGLEIEHKRWSLTVDYRHVPDLEETGRQLTAFARHLPGCRVLGGRHADLNLAPAGEHHKGTALARHVELLGRTAALYVGDDRTDEDAFGQPLASLLSVRVGQKAGSRAQYFLNGQPEIDQLLDRLLTYLPSPSR